MHSEKLALIFGASSGIGLSTAMLLQQEGFIVFNAARRACPLPNVINIEVDVVNRIGNNSVAAAFETVSVYAHTRPNSYLALVVYSAGFSMAAPIELTAESDFRYLFEVNYFGFVTVLQYALPLMRSNLTAKGGRIVVVSSMGGVLPLLYDPFYSSSKAAIDMIVREVNLEVNQFNIYLTSIQAGGTCTEFTAKRKVYDMTTFLAEGTSDNTSSDHSESSSNHSKSSSNHSESSSDHSKTCFPYDKSSSDHGAISSDHGAICFNNNKICSDHSAISSDHSESGFNHGKSNSVHGERTPVHGAICSDHSESSSNHSAISSNHSKTCFPYGKISTNHSKTCFPYDKSSSDHGAICSDHGESSSDHGESNSDHGESSSDHGAICSDHFIKENISNSKDTNTPISLETNEKSCCNKRVKSEYSDKTGRKDRIGEQKNILNCHDIEKYAKDMAVAVAKLAEIEQSGANPSDVAKSIIKTLKKKKPPIIKQVGAVNKIGKIVCALGNNSANRLASQIFKRK